MNEAAWLSEPNTAGTDLPPPSVTITTTLRLPLWFPAIKTVLFPVGGLDVSAIDFRRLAFPIGHAATHFLCHRFAHALNTTFITTAQVAPIDSDYRFANVSDNPPIFAIGPGAMFGSAERVGMFFRRRHEGLEERGKMPSLDSGRLQT